MSVPGPRPPSGVRGNSAPWGRVGSWGPGLVGPLRSDIFSEGCWAWCLGTVRWLGVRLGVGAGSGCMPQSPGCGLLVCWALGLPVAAGCVQGGTKQLRDPDSGVLGKRPKREGLCGAEPAWAPWVRRQACLAVVVHACATRVCACVHAHAPCTHVPCAAGPGGRTHIPQMCPRLLRGSQPPPGSGVLLLISVGKKHSGKRGAGTGQGRLRAPPPGPRDLGLEPGRALGAACSPGYGHDWIGGRPVRERGGSTLASPSCAPCLLPASPVQLHDWPADADVRSGPLLVLDRGHQAWSLGSSWKAPEEA